MADELQRRRDAFGVSYVSVNAATSPPPPPSPRAEAELDTLVPTLLLSNGAVLVDQPLRLRDLITGLAEVELPGHTKQLLALRPASAGAKAAT
jgi:hypothetical protein